MTRMRSWGKSGGRVYDARIDPALLLSRSRADVALPDCGRDRLLGLSSRGLPLPLPIRVVAPFATIGALDLRRGEAGAVPSDDLVLFRTAVSVGVEGCHREFPPAINVSTDRCPDARESA